MDAENFNILNDPERHKIQPIQHRKFKLSEEALVCALKEKHTASAQILYDMYSNTLYSKINFILLDVQSSEDVLQETFIRIWYNFDRYDPQKGRLYTWMLNIATRLAISHLRARNNRQRWVSEDIDLRIHTAVSEDDVERHFDRCLVYSGLAALSKCEFQVMELIYQRGLSHTEAAEALDIPVGTVKTRVRVALRRLRLYYLQELPKAS